ncbi:MAG: rhomboid family intramembrane serine protease [Pseudomonadota bacterium]|nr:rhomboid family intramembrane serine protease [Pseudomonadota bacterium]
MDIINQLLGAVDQIKANIPEILNLIAIAWMVQAANMFMNYRLNIFGIIPRHVIGLPGIVLSPFLHGNLTHIFMNSLFFFAMGAMVSLHGMSTFYVISISITLISGGLVWSFARLACHVGASGLIMGYWSYVMVYAYYNPQLIDLIAAILGMYYFGADLLSSVAPGEKNVSVEGHLAGLAAGVITAAFYQPICQVISTGAWDVFGVYLECIV